MRRDLRVKEGLRAGETFSLPVPVHSSQPARGGFLSAGRVGGRWPANVEVLLASRGCVRLYYIITTRLGHHL